MVVRPALAADRWGGLAATVFRNYGRDQGLPHPVPTALAQGRDGFLWIGTQSGLARWDGYRFRTYKSDRGKPGSLPDDWIQTLHVDTAGRLWIGGSAGGLARYDALNDRFDPIALGQSAGRIHIGAIADDGPGGLWVGTDAGLFHLDASTGAVAPRNVGGPGVGGLPGGGVRAILRDRTGALWVGTTKGLARRAAGAHAFVAIPLGQDGIGVATLLRDADGRIWIGTVRHGLFVVDRAEAAPRPIGAGSLLPTGSVAAICIAGPHLIWAGLRGGGIFAVDTKTEHVTPIRHDRTVASSLAHNDVWALLRDNAGSIWVGSTGGLSYRPRETGLISTVFGAQERPGSLSATDILSVLATRDGHIWLGYLDGGVDVVDPVIGRIAALRPDSARPAAALPADAVYAMAQGAGGGVYLGTRRGLYVADPAAQAVRLLALPGRDPHASITALAYDAGIVWAGGEDDGLRGIAIRGASNGKLLFGPADTAKLSDPGINIILRGAGRDLWVGTRNGLNRVDLASYAVERIMPAPTDRTRLPTRYVGALLVDRRNRLWVGTLGGGIAVMTGRSPDGRPRFHRLGLAEGLPHLNIDSLKMDGAGIIWASTDDGLARIDPATFGVRPVRRAEGSELVDYYAGAGGSDQAGEALFGAKGGLTVVRQGVLPPWSFRPPVVVTDVRIGGVTVPSARFNGAQNVAPIILTPEKNNLAVEFAALDFTSPEHNRYAYRLDGFDRDWIETDPSRRLAMYANLPAGDYTLRLRGSNRDGRWTERALVLPIRVLPAWYQRLWVKIFAALLFLLAMRAIVRWRTSWLRHRRRELESQVTDRTSDLRAANERLGELARTDPLTHCANRRHFMERAPDMIALAARHALPLSLIILDLDNFKLVNDTFGHPCGDAVLAMTGGIIGEHIRASDLCGRIGGEEFALLMPHTAVAGACLLAERLREAIADGAIQAGDALIRATASFGIAELRSGEDFDGIYVRADIALYAAKQSGRNRIEVSGQPVAADAAV